MMKEKNTTRENVIEPMKESLIFKNGVKLLRIGDFIKQYHPQLQQNAIRYCMKVGKIDYTKIGKESFVVLTEKTLGYKPNLHKNRGK